MTESHRVELEELLKGEQTRVMCDKRLHLVWLMQSGHLAEENAMVTLEYYLLLFGNIITIYAS